MIYAYELTIPPQTTADAPETLTVRLSHGILERLEVQFPNGCAGQVGVQIYFHTHQVFPTNPDHWFVSDGYTIAFDESFDLTSPRYEMELRGYNLFDDYPHTVYFRFGVTNVSETLAQKIARLWRGGSVIPAITLPGVEE